MTKFIPLITAIIILLLIACDAFILSIIVPALIANPANFWGWFALLGLTVGFISFMRGSK